VPVKHSARPGGEIGVRTLWGAIRWHRREASRLQAKVMRMREGRQVTWREARTAEFLDQSLV
jgi:hypothetical protein